MRTPSGSPQPGWSRRESLLAVGGLGIGALLGACAGAQPPPPRPLDPARAPQVGNTWRYRYTGGWRNVPPAMIVAQVEEVSAAGIRDRLSIESSAAGVDRLFTSRWELVARTLPGVPGTEFSPYLLAFGAPAAGESQAGIPMPPETFGMAWYAQARAVGPQPITVAAGTFDAIRVDITARRPFVGLDSAIDPVLLYASTWLAPAAKRLVRSTYQTFSYYNGPLSRDDYELVALTVT